ncbi:uncharacterized protein LOC141653277 isoform X1 [Silene latifolia]|uniref:uncharacterized protein LOC141653277 isoform X1 n=1 Tax=Silene latifolia TaxID=37657 RepID=UPI003D77008E
MAESKKEELAGLLTVLPPVEFGCVYGSSLHPNKDDQSRMIDYILGVEDPIEWHSQNLEMNKKHYASWMVRFGGAKTITRVADDIGVGVHFNPYVSWNNKTFKYGVVRTSDLVEDVTNWENFYLSGRLQKPVNIVVDNLVTPVKQLNLCNLRAATSAALLLLPDTFHEEDLYAKICSLSYTGDLRMLFAEDRHKVRKIVQGQFDLFNGIYKPVLEELAAKDLLSFSSSSALNAKVSQDCGLPAVRCLVSRLPTTVKNRMGVMLGMPQTMDSGRLDVVIKSRAEAANCVEKIIRRKVRVSSLRQAVSGVLTVGAIRASRYAANKMSKAWKSRV